MRAIPRSQKEEVSDEEGEMEERWTRSRRPGGDEEDDQGSRGNTAADCPAEVSAGDWKSRTSGAGGTQGKLRPRLGKSVAASEECKVIHESLIKKDELKENPIKPKNNDERQQITENPKEAHTHFTLSWIHLIRYFNNLRRLISRFNLANVSETIHGAFHPDHVLCTSVFNTGLSLRLTALHLFLKRFMKSYLACCVEEPPKELLLKFEKPFTTLPPVLSQLFVPSKVNGRRFEKEKKVPKVKLSSTKSSESKANEQGSMANSSSDKELCFQWYRPAFEKNEDGEPKV
ncbi:hypothetical protein NDU88_002695 [Pleurodeles waltl]|uniref:Uncharacterized protein n=1 Tax=Pleurodeles waltl TaxID=8319 RepID=A0AAV7SBQ8_PLEWA|nr:hypothetical protein NDU88_002695 [Pleurodeles waltl]